MPSYLNTCAGVGSLGRTCLRPTDARALGADQRAAELRLELRAAAELAEVSAERANGGYAGVRTRDTLGTD